MEKRIDLHMHSIYSDDGEFTPTELVTQCKNAGVEIMAIADHNSVKAVKEELQAAKQAGVIAIPAIEIDCTFEGLNLHLLGYNIDYTHPDFNTLEENVFHQEISCSNKKLELTNALGFELTKQQLDKLSDNGVYTGEMFGEVLLNDPRYDSHELLLPYRLGGKRSDNPYVNFYWDFYAQGKPCYVEIVFPTLEEAIALVEKHHGIPVLAHPGNNLKNDYSIFQKMVDKGVKGVEAFSNYHDEKARDYFYSEGTKNKILITCGSDYHGKTKPAISLGESHCFLSKYEIIEGLKKYQLL